MVFKEEIVKKLSAAAVAYGLEYKEIDWLAPLYLPQDHPIIVTLMKLYHQSSGDADLEPIFLGGATYIGHSIIGSHLDPSFPASF
jgi:hypothetical protein